MIQKGLRQVKNPSEVLISEKKNSFNAIAATIEGIRPLMIEISNIRQTQQFLQTSKRRFCFKGFISKALKFICY